jgi:hypothetical protein
MAKKKEAKPVMTGEAYGIEFYVDPNDFKFVVESIAKRFDSYKQMCDSIERSAEKIKKAKRRTCDLLVRGKVCTKKYNKWRSSEYETMTFRVVGLHAGHGALITEPKGLAVEIDRWDDNEAVYPEAATELRAQAMEHKRQCQAELKRAEKALNALTLDVPSRYDFDSDKHEEAVKALEARYAEAERIAKTMTLKELLASIEAFENDD